MISGKISIIIPTLNEEKTIHSALEDLFTQHKPDEVIVADGGSTDRTVKLASEWTRVISCEKGRARQMNVGAREARGDVFLFLHADTKLPEQGLEKIREAIQQGKEAGRFRTGFDENRLSLRFYSSYSRFHFFSYGDQGFFVCKEIFRKLNGFREDVPFEDIDFYKRLRKVMEPVILQEAVITSARRFCSVGCFRQKMINLFLVSLYYLGFNVFKFKEKLYPEIR